MPWGLIFLGVFGAWAGYQAARQAKVNEATADPLGLDLDEPPANLAELYGSNVTE